jgi:vacuolar-type H+-ATPase subunit F/Vma7
MAQSMESSPMGISSDDNLQHVTAPPEAQKNFLVVDAKTETKTIEQAFDNFTQKRKDIGILLINQHVRSREFWAELAVG